jgi:hypothetical protein
VHTARTRLDRGGAGEKRVERVQLWPAAPWVNSLTPRPDGLGVLVSATTDGGRQEGAGQAGPCGARAPEAGRCRTAAKRRSARRVIDGAAAPHGADRRRGKREERRIGVEEQFGQRALAPAVVLDGPGGAGRRRQGCAPLRTARPLTRGRRGRGRWQRGRVRHRLGDGVDRDHIGAEGKDGRVVAATGPGSARRGQAGQHHSGYEQGPVTTRRFHPRSPIPVTACKSVGLMK